MKLHSESVDATRAIGAALAGALVAGDVVVLAGDLGSGKTAFAQGVAGGLGVSARVVSPSFVIVREYEGRLRLHHVDVYRLDRYQELHDLGFEEVIAPDGVTVIEWGDRIAPLLPEDRVEVAMRRTDADETREIDVVVSGSGWVTREAELSRVLEPWWTG